MKRVLFILKKRELYGEDYAHSVSTGLLNSASFVDDMLNAGYDHTVSKLVVVTDNNDIDREVTQFNPTHVIIEALWVVPEKFAVLKELHPKVTWIVRVHSEVPFLANEGVAIDWISNYICRDNVYVAVNSQRFYDNLRDIVWSRDRDKVLYLPNYYPPASVPPVRKHRDRGIRIGCFGAIRPLKNQLLQAMAAIKFADDLGYYLEFHINAGRVEMKGQPVLRNLEGLFKHSGHKLVKHEWLDHPKFLALVKTMDLCLQVSFSETFNIVAADSVVSGVPTVVSREIPWAKVGFAVPTDMDSMTKALKHAWRFRRANVWLNQMGLASYVGKARRIWLTSRV
jgi:glycosyltransferase involved in cell wall biosynthesis